MKIFTVNGFDLDAGPSPTITRGRVTSHEAWVTRESPRTPGVVTSRFILGHGKGNSVALASRAAVDNWLSVAGTTDYERANAAKILEEVARLRAGEVIASGLKAALS